VTLRTNTTGSIGWVIFDRPAKRNCISLAMWQAIPAAVRTLQTTPGVEVVVLRGQGGHFGAGADLNDVLAASENVAAAETYCHALRDAVVAVATCDVPTFALLEGHAAGASVQLALATDWRIAAQNTCLRLPFTRLGVVPDLFTARRLNALVGSSRARQLLYSASVVDADSALRFGLVDETAANDAVEAALHKQIATYAGASRDAVVRTKRALVRGEVAGDLVADMLQSFLHGDVRKGVQATLQALSRKRG